MEREQLKLPTMTSVVLEESDRQAVLLAVAVLALLRPGWNYMLGEIAEKLNGREMFEEFKRLNVDQVHHA